MRGLFDLLNMELFCKFVIELQFDIRTDHYLLSRDYTLF